MLTLRRLACLILAAIVVAPPVASAQAPKAGVVTTLEGNVTATRATAQPVPLKFKDDVFLQDKIATGDQSLARMLLGGKAVVTVRERSVLTVTEIPGRSTIEIDSGKFALAVARERMRPGEVIEIRTPNAIAGVRGSVIVTEVESPAGAPTVVSNLYVLQGSLEGAQPLDPATRAPIGTPRVLNVMEQFRVVGLLGTINPIRPDQLGAIRGGLQPKGKQHTENQNQEQLVADQMQTASALVGGLLGPGGATGLFTTAATPPPPTVAEPTVAVAPITPLTTGGLTSFLESPSAASPSTGLGTSDNPTGNPFLASTVGLVGGLLTNPGFETGTFSGWTLSGAGGVISAFGPLKPREGAFMGLIHTATGTTLSGCGSGSDCTRSILSQSFTATKPIVTVSVRGYLFSNEFPSFTSSNSQFNDRYLLELLDSSGKTFTLFDQRVNQTNFTASNFSATAAGFTLSQGSGIAALDLIKKTQVITPGTTTLRATVSNVSDSIVDSAFVLDAVEVLQDPPVFFITGGTFVRSGTLLALANETGSFDSVLLACCGASVTLDGPALSATDSVLDVPFGAVHAIQGGRITSASSGPLVQLAGGSYALGTITSVFSAAGVNADGTDEPLRHPGTFLDVTNAAVSTGNVMIVDTALLAATAPLLNLTKSALITNDSALDLAFRANVTSLGPLFALNNSSLTIGSGALVSVRNGSGLFVTGDLVRLGNGSTLSLLNGPLASVSGNSTLSVSGALVSFIGAGNTVNISNNLCSLFGCAKVGGLNVALTGGASAANVKMTNAITGAGTVSVAPNAAAVVVSGAGSTVKVGN